MIPLDCRKMAHKFRVCVHDIYCRLTVAEPRTVRNVAVNFTNRT